MIFRCSIQISTYEFLGRFVVISHSPIKYAGIVQGDSKVANEKEAKEPQIDIIVVLHTNETTKRGSNG